MLFNSIPFVIFFSCILALYQIPFSWRTKKIGLLVASYLFYMAWNPPFILLIILSTLIDWFVAKRLGGPNAKNRAALIVTSLATNLGLLGYFKYGGFLLESFEQLLSLAGFQASFPQSDIILPVGISFYTFQTLSYTIDVYRGKAKPWTSFLDFALYVSFFPQLVAGPIVRSDVFLPQCRKQPVVGWDKINWGLNLFILGVFQKVVLADGLLAPVADKVYSAKEAVGSLDAWIGTLAFSGQIFCDFSGYSSCAIGIALCLGFKLPDNFRFPYAARGFSDFWQRWHISLSSWLRDYLYIPLGGNRNGKTRTYINLSVTMLLGGLWHGASWTFVVWGGLHGLYLVVERLLARIPLPESVRSGFLFRAVATLATFIAVSYAWVFFRATGFGQAFDIVQAMSSFTLLGSASILTPLESVSAMLAVSGILLSHWLLRNRSLEQLSYTVPWPLHPIINAVMVTLIINMTAGQDQSFIYFQF